MYCKLSLTDRKKSSPEIEDWLRKVEGCINEEVDRVWMELLVNGTVALPCGKTMSIVDGGVWCDYVI